MGSLIPFLIYSYRLSCYYRNDPARLPSCLSTFHALIHVADSIRDCGPPYIFWQFPMERFCGSLLPMVTSRLHPYTSMVKNVTLQYQAEYLKLLPSYSLPPRPVKKHKLTFESPTYNEIFLPPSRQKMSLTTTEFRSLRRFYITLLETNISH